MNKNDNIARYDLETSPQGFPVLTRPEILGWQGFSQFMDFGETLQKLLDGPTDGLHILAGYFSHNSLPAKVGERSFATDSLIKGELLEHFAWHVQSAAKLSLAFGELKSTQSVFAMQTWYWFCRYYQAEPEAAGAWLKAYFNKLSEQPENASQFIDILLNKHGFPAWFSNEKNVSNFARNVYEEAKISAESSHDKLGASSRLVSLFCLRHADIRWGKKDIKNGLFHPKVYVIERGGPAHDSYVLMGSGNWSNSAFHATTGSGNLEIGLALRLPSAAWQNCEVLPQNDIGQSLVQLSRRVFEQCCPLASLTGRCADEETMLKATRLAKEAEKDSETDLPNQIIATTPDNYLESLAILKDLIFSQFGYEYLKGVLGGIGHYQEEGARRLLPRIERFGGAILADSTGLGKTWVAMRLIVHYCAPNNEFKVAIIVPNQVVDNWHAELKGCRLTSQHGYNISVIEHGFLQQKTISEKHRQLLAADLVIIDESHNFRNAASRRSGLLRSLLKICKNKEPRKTLLLTATPINNSLEDLRAQLALFLMPERELKALPDKFEKVFEDGFPLEQKIKEFLGIKAFGPANLQNRGLTDIENNNLDQFFQTETKRLEKILLRHEEYDPENAILSPINHQLMLRRGRQECEDIERHADRSAPRYFRPSPQRPEKIQITSQRESAVLIKLLSIFKSNESAEGSTFAVHRWNLQKEEDRNGRTSSSAGLQKILFLKRLESSSVSMLQTLTRLAGLHAYRLQSAFEKGFITESDLTSDSIAGRGLADLGRLWAIAINNGPCEFIRDLAETYSKTFSSKNDNEDGDIDQGESDSDDEIIADGQKALTAKILQEFALLIDLVSELAVTMWGENRMDWPERLPFSGRAIWPEPSIWAKMAVKDSKLAALLKKLCRETRDGRRVIVYSQFADTLVYIKSVIDAIGRLSQQQLTDLADSLKIEAPQLVKLALHTAVVTSDTDEKEMKHICQSFAPYYSLSPFQPSSDNHEQQILLREKWQSDWERVARQPVEVLLASDIMAEGVNLQDIATQINFDLHWNPVRMIQRAGRIDRRIKPKIENATSYPDLDQLAKEAGIEIPAHYWRGRSTQAPAYVNFILPQKLEDELRLCQRIARKSLTIKGSIGLDRQLGINDDDINSLIADQPITPDSFLPAVSAENNLFNRLLIDANRLLRQYELNTRQNAQQKRIIRFKGAKDSDPWLVKIKCKFGYDIVRAGLIREPFVHAQHGLIGLVILSENGEIKGIRANQNNAVSTEYDDLTNLLIDLQEADYKSNRFEEIDLISAEKILDRFLREKSSWIAEEDKSAIDAIVQRLAWYPVSLLSYNREKLERNSPTVSEFTALNFPASWLK